MGIDSPDFNTLVAIDFDTTGPDPNIHEIFELYAVPISRSFDPDVRNYPAMIYVKPDMPETIDMTYCRKARIKFALKRGNPVDVAVNTMCKWLAHFYHDRPILPLCWSYRDKLPFLRHFLGEDVYDTHFSTQYRDLQEICRFMSDRAICQGTRNYFSRLTITALAELCGYTGFESRSRLGAYERVKAMPVLYKTLLLRKFI